MTKIIGWNIYLEVEDEITGHMQLIVWNISNWLANEIDSEYKKLLEEEE